MKTRGGVSLLTVGTEITSGEIINSNAASLSQRLEALGFKIDSHLSVPDDRHLLHKALQYLENTSDILFVTGGLGPTSDDFTRESIAAWSGLALEFKEELWQELKKLYEGRGLSLREVHRNQCFFPQGSQVLRNHYGTAHGFYLTKASTKMFVLPGPPREVESMWEPSVVPLLDKYTERSNEVLKRWVCLGVPESEVAEIVEKIIQGSSLTVGYRAHVPYIYVKLWVPKSRDFSKLFLELESQLSQWLVARDEDPIQNWVHAFRSVAGKFSIYDGLTGGKLSSRLEEIFNRKENQDLIEKVQSIESRLNGDFSSASIQLVEEGYSPERYSQNKIAVKTRQGGGDKAIQFPSYVPLASQRARHYSAELAFQYWAELLRELASRAKP